MNTLRFALAIQELRRRARAYSDDAVIGLAGCKERAASFRAAAEVLQDIQDFFDTGICDKALTDRLREMYAAAERGE